MTTTRKRKPPRWFRPAVWGGLLGATGLIVALVGLSEGWVG